LINDGKLYIFDVAAKLVILKLNGDKIPDEDDTEEHLFRVPKGFAGVVETHATPIAVNGRIYFATAYETYCIGDKDAKPAAPHYPAKPSEAEFNIDAPPTGMMVSPFEVHALPGSEVALKIRFVDANGREVKMPADAKIEWSFPAPTPPKGSTLTPPPLKVGAMAGAGTVLNFKLDPMPAQQGVALAKWGDKSATARIRVVPQIPFKQDFEKIPEGAPPAGWVNTTGKYVVKALPDGTKVLSKVNTIGAIPVARANAYITGPDAKDYTIQADLWGQEVLPSYPNMGLVNCRYSFVMDGPVDPTLKKRTVRIVSWEARPRVNQVVAFDWKSGTWYSAKLTVVQKDKTCLVKAKVWERGTAEPETWTVEFEDPSPNREGAAALYGYVSGITDSPGANIYYDNVSVTPNK
jgi:outer membrane protein assembly factor BamB